MGTLNSWDVTDANNNLAPPDGWPENTMNYSDVNNTGRAVQGTMKRYFADTNGSLDAAGAADAYTLTLNEIGYTAYFDGMIFACSIPATNLTTTPTIDVNGIGAQTIVDHNGNAISAGELTAGGIHEFRYDGTNFRIVGTGGVAGLDTEFQFNNAGIFGGSPGLTYNTGNDEVTVVNPLNISNDIVFTEQADHSSTPGPGFGYLWVRDDNPSILIFTDDTGVDTQVGTTGVSLPGGVDTQVQYNDGGNFGGTILTYNDTDDRFEMSESGDPSLLGMMNFEADNLVNGVMIRAIAGAGGSHNLGSLFFGTINSSLGGNPTSAAVFEAQVSNDAAGFNCTIGNDGHAAYFYSLSTARTRPLVWMEYDDGSPGETILYIKNDATDNLSPSIELDGNVGGIQFNGLNRSTDSRTLDWYEEGLTTAYLDTNAFGDGQSDGQTYGANNNAWYTRIGRLVFIQGRLQLTSIGALAGSPLFIVFDPDIPNNFGEATNFHFGISDSSGLAKGADHSVNGYYSGLSAAIVLEISDGAGGQTMMTAAQFSNNGEIFFTGWYQVNSA